MEQATVSERQATVPACCYSEQVLRRMIRRRRRRAHRWQLSKEKRRVLRDS